MSALVIILTVILIVAFMTGSMGVILLFRHTLAPMQPPRGQPAAPTRFVLADILALMVLLQPVLALTLIGRGEAGAAHACVIVLALLLGLAVVASWFSGVNTLSGRGVMATWRRVVYLLVVGPLTTIGCITAVSALFFAVLSVFWDAISREWRAIPETALILFILTGTAGVAFGVAAALVRWVARGAEGKSTITPAAGAGQLPPHP